MKRGEEEPRFLLSAFLGACYQCSEALEPTSSHLHPSRSAGLALAKAHSRTSAFQFSGILLSPSGVGCLETTLVSSGLPFFHLSHEEDLAQRRVVCSGLRGPRASLVEGGSAKAGTRCKAWHRVGPLGWSSIIPSALSLTLPPGPERDSQETELPTFLRGAGLVKYCSPWSTGPDLQGQPDACSALCKDMPAGPPPCSC